jgi:hypothetical protein
MRDDLTEQNNTHGRVMRHILPIRPLDTLHDPLTAEPKHVAEADELDHTEGLREYVHRA